MLLASEDIKQKQNERTNERFLAGFQARSKDQEILEEAEVELDPHFCPEEIMSREVELG